MGSLRIVFGPQYLTARWTLSTSWGSAHEPAQYGSDCAPTQAAENGVALRTAIPPRSHQVTSYTALTGHDFLASQLEDSSVTSGSPLRQCGLSLPLT